MTGVTIPTGAANLQGRARVDATALDSLGINAEVDFIRHVARERRLVIPVRVPGRETTVILDYEQGTAVVSSRAQPFSDVLMYLHKVPGPHNVDVRGNSLFMRLTAC